MIFSPFYVRAYHQKEKDISAFMHKIAVVIPKYGLIGGAEQFVAELTERLASRTGYEFHVLANRWQPAATADSIEYLLFLSPNL